MRAKPPKSLFKYVSFDKWLPQQLEQLCLDQVYFSDPASFNDPLDCRPVVEPNLNKADLETLLAQLVVQRADKEIDAAMKKLRLRGEKATERRSRLTESEAREILGEINYNATHPDIDDAEAFISSSLGLAIEQELRKTHETGVLCLSAKFDSPLMWSHYGNQHKGLCIEYDVANLSQNELHKVSYGESRQISASQIRDDLLHADAAARQAINKACLLTKSHEWRYEHEWRLLGRVGIQESPIHLKSVIFGMRCPHILQYTVVKALQGRIPKLRFWKISWPTAEFKLKRVRLDNNELINELPRCSVFHDFDDLDSIEHIESPRL